MGDTPQDDEASGFDLPPNLRYLKTLVTILTAVMILGVVTITLLLVIRITGDDRPILLSPDLFELPVGVEVAGYSQTGQQIVIVGTDGLIRVFDAETREQTHLFDPTP
ncbi:MAG: DUF6476 family protein [Pseudomonadota bacterium]